MLKIFERISNREAMGERFQEETWRIQAKKKKKLLRKQETEQFSQQRQAVNHAVSQRKEQ